MIWNDPDDPRRCEIITSISTMTCPMFIDVHKFFSHIAEEILCGAITKLNIRAASQIINIEPSHILLAIDTLDSIQYVEPALKDVYKSVLICSIPDKRLWFSPAIKGRQNDVIFEVLRTGIVPT